MRPNILYVNSHDTGRYIQPYGYPVPTPNLQRFAEGATMFRQCFCMGPTCSPSRAALLTGQAPHAAGMCGLAHLGWSLKDYRQHWIHTFHEAGYASHFTGGQHIAEGTGKIGYHHIHEAIGPEAWAATTADFLRNPPAEPWIYEVGFGYTHREFPEPGPEDDPRYLMPPNLFPDTPRTRADWASYRACARKLDACYGAIFDALEASPQKENTLVIVTTDHGIDFPGMKCTLTDHGIGVLLLMRGPGGFEAGNVVDGMVSHVDVFPTLCDLLGIDRPAWLQGTSFLPLVRGEAEEVNEAVFAEINYHAAYEPVRAVRTRRWKYIRRMNDQRRPPVPNTGPCLTLDVWREHGWPERPEAGEQLFDLAWDPQERCNLAARPEHAGTLAAMRERLDAWMRETEDPILPTGWIEPPEGALIWDAGDGSNQEHGIWQRVRTNRHPKGPYHFPPDDIESGIVKP